MRQVGKSTTNSDHKSSTLTHFSRDIYICMKNPQKFHLPDGPVSPPLLFGARMHVKQKHVCVETLTSFYQSVTSLAEMSGVPQGKGVYDEPWFFRKKN